MSGAIPFISPEWNGSGQNPVSMDIRTDQGHLGKVS
ncbi:hypothetical protein SFR_4479 [Streptomyces sp. FR-008]|nr:hypothetical protein SFR_4479 [Streptomyces sp. FR-008]